MAISHTKVCFFAIAQLLRKLKWEDVGVEIKSLYFKDLNCFNLVLGLGSHRSSKPCMFCLWECGSLEDMSERTLGSLRQNFESFKTKDLAKNEQCCNEPHIWQSKPDNTKMWEVSAIPLLRWILGFILWIKQLLWRVVQTSHKSISNAPSKFLFKYGCFFLGCVVKFKRDYGQYFL